MQKSLFKLAHFTYFHVNISVYLNETCFYTNFHFIGYSTFRQMQQVGYLL